VGEWFLGSERDRYLFSHLLICMRFQLIYNLIMDWIPASIASAGKIWSSIYISHSIPPPPSLSLSLYPSLTLFLSLFPSLSLFPTLSLTPAYTTISHPCLLMVTHLLTQKRLFIKRQFPLFRWGKFFQHDPKTNIFLSTISILLILSPIYMT